MSRIVIYRSSLALCATVLSAGLFSYSSVYAADEGSRQIEEVIVTAERQEASIQDTSISITALTGDFLDDFGIRNQEDFQNFIPATTIQPYDSTIRGVGRNFRALGGDPGVATYIDGVYSEDLLTATAQTFWDVERVEVLRGPQGTLYGRNAVGGAINILHKEPTDFFEGSVRGIVGNFGNFGTQDYYGAFSGPIVEDKLTGRVNFAYRERDGVIEEIGPGEDLDGLGTENIAVQLKWTPSDTIEINLRQNWLDTDRSFGGANGGGLVVQNEEGDPQRVTNALIPGYRFIDINNTAAANFDQNNWYDSNEDILTFTNPITGAQDEAQRNRAGIDEADFDGFQNAAASLDGFNNTSTASADEYNRCVFPDEISGDEICGSTNGLNREEFRQQGTQFSINWDVVDSLSLKYIFGYNQLSYQRTTDDDNTASQFHDRQFYVNHEADYTSHELQAFWDISENISLTTGVFFYDATIDQRGDFYSSLRSERKYTDAYTDNSSLSAAAARNIAEAELAPAVAGAPTAAETAAINTLTTTLTGQSASQLINGTGPMVTLFTAKNSCLDGTAELGCARNFSVDSGITNAFGAVGQQFLALNLASSAWLGDNGSTPGLDVINGPNTLGSDLLYATQTERESFAFYSQGVWDVNEDFALTAGVRYAYDDVTAEENLFRYTEAQAFAGLGNTNLAAFASAPGANALAELNRLNGGLVTDPVTGVESATSSVVNGGVPRALSIYRPFQRKDEKVTGRINLDWSINEETLLYLSATSGYRSGGYNLVFFSNTPTYDPEELIAYEFGYKGQHFDNTLQINGSIYYYDYESIHTVGTEITALGGTSTSVNAAPGAEIFGLEVEGVWLATDSLTLGGNFSFTPSEYTEDLFILDPTNPNSPNSLYENQVNPATGEAGLALNINGNQLLQVPELKFTGWANYSIPLNAGSKLDFNTVYSWVDEVYYSPFEAETERADSYGRLDFRATWKSADEKLLVSGYVNNILDDVGVLQVLREG
ncbi:TonB-dependent receptor [Pseudomonadales bacterium]|nr:TonB-dependent receptor [Pseudomonadales bacterium]